MRHFEIVISGAGYVGLLTALCLLNANKSCAMIESKNIESVLTDDGRNFALSSETISLLKTLNLFDEIVSDFQKINKVVCFEDGEISTLNIESTELLGGMISSHKFKIFLLKKLQTFDNFQLIDNFLWENIFYDDFLKKSYLTKSSAIDEDSISADLIISTEGKNSKMIDYFKLQKITHNYNQEAVTFNISHNFENNGIAVEKFFTDGAIAILPTINKHQSSIVWINNTLQSNFIRKLSESEFHELLNEKLEHCLGDINIVGTKTYFPLQLSFLLKYSHHNIIFLGDINHSIHPIAGQGLNLTISDLNKLISLIKQYDIHKNFKKICSKLHCSRMIPNFKMIGFTHFLVKIFGNNNLILKKTRNFGIKILDIFMN